MPYIKSISIGNNVKGCLKYIANPEKTQNGILVTGINCSDNIEIAEQEMCLTYQNYSRRDFYAKPLSDKSPIKAFHFVQSFKADECNAELAHKISTEWVKKAFGENFQAVITTHTDTGNVHNHICLCPYDLDGKKFNSNKKSLERIRKISDEICRNYEIGKMEKLMNEENHIAVGITYGEWKHRKQGTSWKEIIRRKIDILIHSAKSFDELLEELERQGFAVKRGKYVSVKAPNQQRAVRLKTLGVQYSEENIVRRILGYLDSLPKIKPLDKIISEVMTEFQSQTKSFSFAKSVKDTSDMIANQLTVVNCEKLNSVSQVKERLSELEKQEQTDEIRQKIKIYREILETCSDEDYISKLVRLSREKMDGQEKARLKALENESYELYYRSDENYTALKNQRSIPNIDDYFAHGGGSWIDIEGEDLANKLENVYAANQLPIGAVILVKKQNGQQAYYVDEIGFKAIPDFMNSRSEQLLHEEKQKQTAVKKKSHGR